MRISISQCALALLLSLSISGCYSGGKWSMPNMAFWRTSPFNSPGPSTAGTYPPPAAGTSKPSNLAANNSNSNLTTAPAYQTTVGVGTTAGASVPQYPYPATTTQPAARRHARHYVYLAGLYGKHGEFRNRRRIYRAAARSLRIEHKHPCEPEQ